VAISLKGGSAAWNEFTTNSIVNPVPAGSPAAGDIAFLWIVWKNQSVTSSVTGTSTKLVEYKDSSVASGAGVGGVTIAVYYRVWQAGDANMGTINFTAAVGVGAYCTQTWQKAANDTWNTPTAVSGPILSQTATLTGSTSTADATVPDGSVVMNAIGIADDSAVCSRRTDAGINGWVSIGTDDFTRADSTTSAGPAWTNSYGTAGVASNQWRGYLLFSQVQAASTFSPAGSNLNRKATATLATIGGGSEYMGIYPGYDGSGGAVHMYQLGTTIGIGQATSLGGYSVNIAGSGTARATVSAGAANGDVMAVSRTGNLYTAYRKGCPVVVWDDTGVIGQAGTESGLSAYLNGTTPAGRWDNFKLAEQITWNGNYVESPATHHSTTTGNDMAADLGHRFVTTGGTAELDCAVTLSNAETGASVWVVQSIIAGPTPSFVPPVRGPHYDSLIQM
jgi:hypothetical protein